MEGSSDLVLFFGRFHPLILHFPIGFLAIAFALEVMSRFDQFKQYKPAVGFVLLLGTASAVVAALLGYMLSQAGGYNEELLAIHQWTGIGLALAAVAALVLRWQSRRRLSAPLDKAYLSVLTTMMLLLIVAGHFGGSLTHGSDYLTQYMPNGLRKVAGMPPKQSKEIKKITNLEEAVVFSDIIFPILDTRCVSCHNDSKSKGDLMMHSMESLLKGGESGPVFIPGKAEESEMMKRIHLPESEEEHMPPKGKSQLSDEQIKLLTWWVNEGASFDKKVAEVAVDKEVQEVLDLLLDPDAHKTAVEMLLAAGTEPADGQVLHELEATGVQVLPLAAGSPWLQARLAQDQPLEVQISQLTKIVQQLSHLNLEGTEMKDDEISAIAQFKNLTRLRLEHSNITDKGLQHLKQLPYLEYLNLYDTQVSDEGIQQLAELKNLKKLYLWQTQVTAAGAQKLKEALPGLEVSLGVEAERGDSLNIATTQD